MIVPDLLDSEAVAKRYGVSRDTAIQYMRKMRHTENPLRVTAQDMIAWDNSRMVDPEAEKQARAKKPAFRWAPEPENGWKIPRKKIG
jgi:transposase